MTPAGSMHPALDADLPTAASAERDRQECAIIINADDWGRNAETTDRIAECCLARAISSTSAMVFMEDSGRAAALAAEHSIDAGLHLNLTAAFTAAGCPSNLLRHHERVRRFLTSSRLARMIYQPLLAASFEYTVRAQFDAFARLYGAMPGRVDGHHHMHLCANVWFQHLVPDGLTVRRNFTPEPSHSGGVVRMLRRWQDAGIQKRYRTTDYFFPLPPLDSALRLHRILDLARQSTVELETHPVNPAEYSFLLQDKVLQGIDNIAVSRGYVLSRVRE